MAREPHGRDRRGLRLREVPGTTLAVASLALLGVGAVVATPLWLWYRRKRKRADALAYQAPPPTVTEERPTLPIRARASKS